MSRAFQRAIFGCRGKNGPKSRLFRLVQILWKLLDLIGPPFSEARLDCGFRNRSAHPAGPSKIPEGSTEMVRNSCPA
jgi:hypothetical protein